MAAERRGGWRSCSNFARGSLGTYDRNFDTGWRAALAAFMGWGAGTFPAYATRQSLPILREAYVADSIWADACSHSGRLWPSPEATCPTAVLQCWLSTVFALSVAQLHRN